MEDNSIQHQEEVILSLDETVVKENLSLLKSVEKSWHGTDEGLLPNLENKNTYPEQVVDLRRKAEKLDDKILVALVGNTITEEALPSYSIALNTIVKDKTGTSQRPWAQWLRGWTAEEKRHGTVLDRYLYLSGRVNMKEVEVTEHHLLRNGFNSDFEDVYGGMMYTSFQEAATKISHYNVGRLAENEGDDILAKICKMIASDESRHEKFYTKVAASLFEQDPNGAVISFWKVMKNGIDMPAKLMTDGKDAKLFSHFAVTAQKAGVYTFRDYTGLMEQLLDEWNVQALSVQGEGAQAQEKLYGLLKENQGNVERIEKIIHSKKPVAFSWIYGREA